MNVPDDQTTGVPAWRRRFDDVLVLGGTARVRLIALVIVGIVAWALVVSHYPLQDAVPRYAEF